MGLREWLLNARGSPIVERILERGLQNSLVVDWIKARPSPVMTVGSWTRSSATAEALRNTSEVAGESFDRSGIGRAVRAIATFTRSSFCYRWLTAEPEPEVIVIDLGDTMFLGPLLQRIDGIVETFLAKRHGSRLYGTGQRTFEFVEDAPVRALSIVVLTAIATNLLVSIFTGPLTTAGILVRLGLALLAILGIENDTTMDELRDTRGARLLVARLEPPDLDDPDVGATGEKDDTKRTVQSGDTSEGN